MHVSYTLHISAIYKHLQRTLMNILVNQQEKKICIEKTKNPPKVSEGTFFVKAMAEVSSTQVRRCNSHTEMLFSSE